MAGYRGARAVRGARPGTRGLGTGHGDSGAGTGAQGLGRRDWAVPECAFGIRPGSTRKRFRARQGVPDGAFGHRDSGTLRRGERPEHGAQGRR
jgi:hypothetical protein